MFLPQAGLQFDGDLAGPLLRPPSHQGPVLCKRGVTSSEVGKLLRGLVGEAINVVDVHSPHISAHSLKATGLAWAARYGMAWPDRAILGRHQSHTNETIAIYSRDLAVGPVSRFAGVLSSIQKGEFCPDAERSKYFQFPPNPPPTEGAQDLGKSMEAEPASEPRDSMDCKLEFGTQYSEGSVIIVQDSESESSDSADSDSGNESTSSEDLEPDAKKGTVPKRAPAPKTGTWFVHQRSGLLHFCWADPSMDDRAKRTTGCGRTVSKNYKEMDSKTNGNQICTLCQRRQ